MKQYLIVALIVSLVTAGLVGIGVLLQGEFEQVQVRILFTTLAFTTYSIIGLCCNSVMQTKFSAVGKVGLIVAIIGLLYAVITTWATPEDADFLRLRFSLLVIGLGFAHCSLMLLINKSNLLILAVVSLSIASSIIAVATAVAMISSKRVEASAFQFLGVVSIIGVTATIIAPILAFTAKRSDGSTSGTAAATGDDSKQP